MLSGTDSGVLAEYGWRDSILEVTGLERVVIHAFSVEQALERIQFLKLLHAGRCQAIFRTCE